MTETSIIGPVPCPRCGRVHSLIEFSKLSHPIKVGEYSFTHYGLCPTNGQPILRREVTTQEVWTEIAAKSSSSSIG